MFICCLLLFTTGSAVGKTEANDPFRAVTQAPPVLSQLCYQVNWHECSLLLPGMPLPCPVFGGTDESISVLPTHPYKTLSASDIIYNRENQSQGREQTDDPDGRWGQALQPFLTQIDHLRKLSPSKHSLGSWSCSLGPVLLRAPGPPTGDLPWERTFSHCECALWSSHTEKGMFSGIFTMKT